MYVSADRSWKVRPITLDGRELIRVEHNSPLVNGLAVVHADGYGHRNGPQQTSKGWWLIADVASVADVARYVELAELEAV